MLEGVKQTAFGVSLGRDDTADPARIMEAAGLPPDPWQAGVLRSQERRTLMLCTRQGGKSTTVAAKALHRALVCRGALILILSPSSRQSKELLTKVRSLYHAGRYRMRADESALQLELANRSRILALPGSEKTIRGFSGVKLLIIDEAARVEDELYRSVRPMLAVSGGELLALTTPWGKRGWFYEEWTDGGDDWHRVRITADDCPRITPTFLEEERRRLGELWYRQEYFCAFVDLMGSLFHWEDIDRAFTGDFEPFFSDALGQPAEHVTTFDPFFSDE